MNEIEIVLGGCVGLIVVLFFIAQWRKRKEERQMRIDAAVERVELANKPGYRSPGDSSMRTTIKDGVITYRKDRSQKKDKDKSGR